jgi:hypothetical protein
MNNVNVACIARDERYMKILYGEKEINKNLPFAASSKEECRF